MTTNPQKEFRNVAGQTSSRALRAGANQTKRCTIDLTPAAREAVERIQKTFGLTMADVFRYALVLLHVYANAVVNKKEVRVVDPKSPRVVKIIELPLFSDKGQLSETSIEDTTV